jgi:putative membrane protein
LLHNYRQAAITLLTGFMVGSMRKIWPFKILHEIPGSNGEIFREQNVLPNLAEPIFWWALALALLGFVLICAMDHMQTRNNPSVRLVQRIWKRK